VTAEKQGQIAATTGWVGSEAEIGGHHPTYWRPYAQAIPLQVRVAEVLGYFDLPAAQRPTLLTLYTDTVDNAAHRSGVGSPQEQVAIEQVDQMIGLLIRGLERRGLYDRVNLILVAGHGMTPMRGDQIIYLDDLIALDSVRVPALGLGPTASLYPTGGDAEALYRRLQHAHPHLTVYRRAEIPARYQNRNHPRVPPVLVVADEGWIVSTRANERMNRMAAMHGYDPQLRSMHGIFLARGPAFKRGLVVEPFRNVHVYPLMAHLLGLTPAPNDGSLDSVRVLLRPQPGRSAARSRP